MNVIEIPKEELIKLYLTEQKTAKEIADMLSVSEALILKKLKIFNITRRKSGSSKPRVILNKEKLKDLYINQNIPANEIAKIEKVNVKTVYKNLQRFNLLPPKNDWNSLVGRKYGKLLVKTVSLKRGCDVFVKCICECGTERNFRAASVKAGQCRSCGCGLRKLEFCGNLTDELSGSFFNRIKSSAKKREYSFEISMEQIWELFLKQNNKCKISGVEIHLNFNVKNTTASLDRIDSSKGYTVENIQWIHKDINRMKNNLPEKVFFNWIKTISRFQQF